MGMPGVVNAPERLSTLLSAEFVPVRLSGGNEKIVSSHTETNTTSVPPTDSVAHCSMVGCLSQTNINGITAMCEVCDYVSTRSSVSTTYTLNHVPDKEVRINKATSVETPSRILISVDEIDNEKTDTFFPFLSEKTTTDVQPPGPEDFLNDITFEGDEDLVMKLRALCLKYAGNFSNKLAAKPAKLPPFVIDADKKQWEVPKNRTPVRLQTS